MGETENARLEARMDRLEKSFGDRLDRITEKLERIVESQMESKSTATGLERAFEEIGKIQKRLDPLERDAPFVQIVTDSLKGILRGLIRGAWIIGAALLIGQLYPYAPWVQQKPVPVSIKPSVPDKP